MAYESFKTNKTHATEGIWIDFEGEGFAVKITHAHSTNKKFQTVSNAVLKPVRRRWDQDLMKTDEKISYMRKIYAKSIIVDWKIYNEKKKEWEQGIVLPNGKVGEFNEENVLEVIKAVPVLFEELVEQSTSFANFRDEDISESAKN